MQSKQDLIVITGAAGLVGQNLVLLLRQAGYSKLLAIDCHAGNLAILSRLNPGVETRCVDLAEPGSWQDVFANAAAVVQLHAQITGLHAADFERNNVQATRHVLDACKRHAVPYLVHVSSSVLNSVAEDDYTRSKRAQEALVLESALPACILRPTLMFGWFDPKHFGWLSRFMARTPVFPIPGDGRFLRQPLYNRDFCRVIMACLHSRPVGKTYDIVGAEDIEYIDIIRSIRAAKGLHTLILHIPLALFDGLLRAYALLFRNPPFTSSQLNALMAGDYFRGVDMEKTFGVKPTPFAEAIHETFTHPVYAGIAVGR